MMESIINRLIIELPMEMIMLIIEENDYQRWRDGIKEINREYHDRYEWKYSALECRKCDCAVFNHRHINGKLWKSGYRQSSVFQICHLCLYCDNNDILPEIYVPKNY